MDTSASNEADLFSIPQSVAPGATQTATATASPPEAPTLRLTPAAPATVEVVRSVCPQGAPARPMLPIRPTIYEQQARSMSVRPRPPRAAPAEQSIAHLLPSRPNGQSIVRPAPMPRMAASAGGGLQSYLQQIRSESPKESNQGRSYADMLRTQSEAQVAREQKKLKTSDSKAASAVAFQSVTSVGYVHSDSDEDY